jgi:hypothetical protein
VIARDLCISAVTPMAVRRELSRRIALIQGGTRDPHFSHDDLFQMTRNAEGLWREFAAEDRIIPMTAQIATRWGDLLDQAIDYVDANNATYQIGSVQKLEIATAIVGRGDIGYVYVERAQASHNCINGLAVEDPTSSVQIA